MIVSKILHLFMHNVIKNEDNIVMKKEVDLKDVRPPYEKEVYCKKTFKEQKR